MPNTLPAFNPKQFQKAKEYLATRVAEMMGRKFEEGDWAKVYCTAKGIPLAAWSNLDIDIMYGNLGVEHKMLCRRENKPILDACGTSPMHPAGTRALRIPPGESDPTRAARDVLKQYGEVIDKRAAIVRAVNRYHHNLMTRGELISELRSMGMTSDTAEKTAPKIRMPNGFPDDPLDMRTGWLLWQQSLREFLYFEEPLLKPIPNDFTAEWSERADGRRRGSRNLWVYRNGLKLFSITNEAGVKLQPYFNVPSPNDPNLYHFTVQGEKLENGLVRVWLTEVTYSLLRARLGEEGLQPFALSEAIERVADNYKVGEVIAGPFDTLAVQLEVSVEAYDRLRKTFNGVSDEHNFKQLLDVLSL